MNEESQPNPPTMPVVAGPKEPLADRISRWVHKHPWHVAVIGTLVTAALVVGLTDLKYPVLGTFIKSKIELTIQDSETKEPIQGVAVKAGGAAGTTDENGQLVLDGVTPGNQNIQFEKTAYQTTSVPAKLKFGTNQLGVNYLDITGVRLKFAVTNRVSRKPLPMVKVKIGEVSALTDKSGLVTLSVERDADEKAIAEIARTGYLSVKTDIKLVKGQETASVKLTPVGKVYFLSNRDRRIDLMRSNLDGSDRELVLAGTGDEDSETGILPSINNPSLLALVSSRNGNRDEYGNLRHDLFIVNGDTKKLTLVHSDVGFNNYRAWAGDNLVYEYLSYEESSKSSIFSYNSRTGKQVALVAKPNEDYALVLRLSLVANNHVYYSVNVGSPNERGFYVVNPDGTGRRRISSVPADQISRPSKNTAVYEYYASPPLWRSVNLLTSQVTSLGNGPSTEYERGYADSPNSKYTAFVEERDGRSELYIASVNGSNEKRLTNGAKVAQFVQWYGEAYIVFSVTEGESALYIVALDGGKPVKISDHYRGNGRTYGGGYNPVY